MPGVSVLMDRTVVAPANWDPVPEGLHAVPQIYDALGSLLARADFVIVKQIFFADIRR